MTEAEENLHIKDTNYFQIKLLAAGIELNLVVSCTLNGHF